MADLYSDDVDDDDVNRQYIDIMIYNLNYYSSNIIANAPFLRYSGLACVMVILLGSFLSLVPGFKQKTKPNLDLLVPVLKVSFNK